MDKIYYFLAIPYPVVLHFHFRLYLVYLGYFLSLPQKFRISPSLLYTKVKILFQPITTPLQLLVHRAYRTVIGCQQPITSSITYHHPDKDNAGIQIKAHEQTEVSTGDNFSFKAGNHSFMQVKL